MSEIQTFYHLACALALGFVVGLQRENSFSDPERHHPAGVRTFSIVGLMGALMAYMGMLLDSVTPFVVGFAVLGVMLAAVFHKDARLETPGLTTASALLLVYGLGGLCMHGEIIEATAIGVVLIMLLTIKVQLHTFAKRITQADLIASLKFALITAIVLPLLPNQYYGPGELKVLNPFSIWLFVIFISGIGFVGYVLIKVVGAGRGIGLTSVLGGIASSTALTLSFTQRSKDNPEYSTNLAMGVLISWSVMYMRVYLICGLVAPSLWKVLLVPLLAPVVPGLIYSWWLKQREEQSHSQSGTFTNPFELLPAIKFGLVFTVVMFIAKAAKVYLGNAGLLGSSFVAGFADMDAIALSLAQMIGASGLSLKFASMGIVLAGVANTITKGGMVIAMGAPQMRKAMLPAMGLMLATATGTLVWLYYA